MTLGRLVFGFLTLPLLGQTAFGQTAPKFEVATIKPAAADGPINRVAQNNPGRIAFQMTLKNLIYWAYGTGLSTELRVTGGPDWVGRTPYEVEGVSPGKATQRQFREMLRALLEERFSLKVHIEQQPFDVYAMVPARNDGRLGPKVEVWDGTCGGRAPSGEDDPRTPRCPAMFRPPGLFLDGATMYAAAEMLSTRRQDMGRVVEDHTGLTGRYKMELDFPFGQSGAPPDSDAPSIFTAIREQWGLKLEPAKGTLEVIVVDSAQPPTAN